MKQHKNNFYIERTHFITFLLKELYKQNLSRRIKIKYLLLRLVFVLLLTLKGLLDNFLLLK